MAIYRFGWELLWLDGCLWFGRTVACSSKPKEGAILADRFFEVYMEKLTVVYCNNRRYIVDKMQRF